MGSFKEFSLPVQLFLRAYPWRRIDPIPWSPVTKPLSECRLALISSAGLVAPEQPPFEDEIRGGDPSFREIALTTNPSTLRDTHNSDSFDHSGITEDPNLAFPLAPVRPPIVTRPAQAATVIQLSIEGVSVDMVSVCSWCRSPF